MAEGNQAPLFELQDQNNQTVKLENRRGQKWTILYFYPKSFTPGCTKQACRYNESIGKIRDLQGEVYGISCDSVKKQNEFHQQYNLSFSLLSDPECSVMNLYDVKMPVLSIAKRWTFILDSELVIRKIFKAVDPERDTIDVIDFITQEK